MTDKDNDFYLELKKQNLMSHFGSTYFLTNKGSVGCPSLNLHSHHFSIICALIYFFSYFQVSTLPIDYLGRTVKETVLENGEIVSEITIDTTLDPIDDSGNRSGNVDKIFDDGDSPEKTNISSTVS